MLIPYTVIRYFQETPTVKEIFFSAADASLVVPITAQVHRITWARIASRLNEIQSGIGRTWADSIAPSARIRL